jgi:hypothetical protein
MTHLPSECPYRRAGTKEEIQVIEHKNSNGDRSKTDLLCECSHRRAEEEAEEEILHQLSACSQRP